MATSHRALVDAVSTVGGRCVAETFIETRIADIEGVDSLALSELAILLERDLGVELDAIGDDWPKLTLAELESRR